MGQELLDPKPEPESVAAPGGRRFGVALLAIFVVGLALRTGFAWEVSDLPTFRYPVMDAATHLRLAHTIAAGEWLPREPFYQAPLYPYVLALLERMTGDASPSAGAARAVQVLLSAATPLLVALAVAPVFGRRAALAAGLLGALYGPHVVFAPLLLKETLAIALLAAALALLLPALSRPPAADRAAAAQRGVRLRSDRAPSIGVLSIGALSIGILLGLAAQLRENLLVLLPLTCAAVVWSNRRRWMAAVLVAIGGGLALLPAGWANARAGGPWFLTSSQSGMNFYIGNVLSATGTYEPLSAGAQHPEAQREDARRLATGLLAARVPGGEPRTLTDPEVSRVFWAESRRAIAEAPGRWGARFARKAWLFWSNYEVPDAEGWVVLRELSAVLALAPVTFAPLLGLAAVGLLPAWRRNPRASALLLAFAGAIFLSVVAFFVFARYRLPTIVLLLPFAGVGGTELFAAASGRRWGKLAAGLALGSAVTLLAFTTPLSPADRAAFSSALWFNLGQAGNRESVDRLERARAESAGSLRSADLRAAGQSAAGAASFLERALAAQPSFQLARVERAVALERGGLAALLGGNSAVAEELYGAARAELDRVGAPGDEDPELGAQVDALRSVILGGLARARAANGALSATPP